MPIFTAPAGHVDMAEAMRITGYSRQWLIRAAKNGDIPGGFQRVPRGPWSFTEAGLRQWIGQPSHTKAGVA